MAGLVVAAMMSRTAGAQRPERLQETRIQGIGVSLKAGWQVLFHDGCRFAVPGSWRPDVDGGLVSAPGGSNLSVRSFRIASWSAHKAQMRATFGEVKALHEDSDRRLWVEIGDDDRSQHYIDVANGLSVCVGLLEIHAATTPDAADTTNRIADSIGPAPNTLSIGVVIDVRPQQRDVLGFERQVVDSLRSTLAAAAAEGFVVGYADHVRLIADWSPVAVGLKDASGRLAVDGSAGKMSGAVLNDGLMDGLTRLASAPGDRKGLIVIGEGNDSDSASKFSQVLAMAKARHVQCFALLVAQHRSQVGRVRQFGFDLYRLTSATDGKLYDVRTNPKLLGLALQDILKRVTAPIRD